MTTLITIRLADAFDLAGIETTLERAFPRLLKSAYPPSTMVTAVPRLQRADPRQVAGGRHYVAEDVTGRIVGSGGWARLGGPWSGPRRGAVRQFVTDPDRTRQGVGRALMDAVIRAARAEKVVRLDCQATLNAVPFYAACGFRPLGRRIITLAPGIDFVFEHMQRRL